MSLTSSPVTTFRSILHVDLDAFFASVEQKDHPEYRGRPVVIGADPQSGRGVVSTASYEARKFGIHSAMPITTAYRLCPHALYLPPRMGRYQELSHQVMEVLEGYSPLVEQVGIDEAFLDCTGTEALLGSAPRLARSLKEEVFHKTGLTISVGGAGNKFTAKVASDMNKPDGLTLCEPGKEREFLAPLPVEKLWGAGEKTVRKIHSFGVRTIGEFALLSPEWLRMEMGEGAVKLWMLANGVDDRPVEEEGRRKSISEETTFLRDQSEDEVVEQALFRIADTLSRKMRKLQIKGRTVTLKVRLEGFVTFTRSRTLREPIHDTRTIRHITREIYRSFSRGSRRIRLVGIALSNLRFPDESPPEQLTLFSEGGRREKEREEGLDRVLDNLKERFGERVTRATFLESSGHPPEE